MLADDFSHEAQAKRLYGLGEMEREGVPLGVGKSQGSNVLRLFHATGGTR
jgi:hypothetical protein